MKIIAIGASNSTKSINKALATHAVNLLKANHKPDAQIEVLDLNDFELPIFSPQLEETNGVPKPAKDFYAKLGEAGVIVISYAEYNGSYTPVWKNIFDWMSRIDMKVFQDKPVLALATSPGGRGGTSVLAQAIQSAQFFGADIKGSLSVPAFYDNFDMATGTLNNAELAAKLNAEVAKLA